MALIEPDENGNYPFVDLIEVEMFGVQIPLFTNYATMIETISAISDIPTDSEPYAFNGMVVHGSTEAGTPVTALYLHPNSSADVWVHEASHLVDFVIFSLGLDETIHGTETRAYMLQHFFREITAIMSSYQTDVDFEGSVH